MRTSSLTSCNRHRWDLPSPVHPALRLTLLLLTIWPGELLFSQPSSGNTPFGLGASMTGLVGIGTLEGYADDPHRFHATIGALEAFVHYSHGRTTYSANLGAAYVGNATLFTSRLRAEWRFLRSDLMCANVAVGWTFGSGAMPYHDHFRGASNFSLGLGPVLKMGGWDVHPEVVPLVQFITVHDERSRGYPPSDVKNVLPITFVGFSLRVQPHRPILKSGSSKATGTNGG